jgi:hypothetical protein
MEMGQSRWGRLVLQEIVLPELPRLQQIAHKEYKWMIRKWRKHPAQTAITLDAERFDAERFSLLQELCVGRLQMLLHGSDRRVLFNTARSFQPDELRRLLGTPDPDRLLISYITGLSTRSIVRYAESRAARRLSSRPGIRLTPAEVNHLSDELPEQLARLFALCALTSQAENAFRGAGKGMRLQLDADGRPVEPEPGSPDSGVGWAWVPDPKLMAAVNEYDARRRRTDGSVAGLPAPETFGEDCIVWLTAGIYDLPLTMTYPDGQKHTTQHFMVRLRDISARLQQLADLDAQFTAEFGLSVDAFGRICKSLAQSVLRLAAIDAVRLSPERRGRQHASCRLRRDDPRLETAPAYLHEVLSEGSLRASRAHWLDTLSKPYYAGHKAADSTAIDSFLSAFTSSPDNDPYMLRPVLFHEIGRDTLLFDLVLATDFVDLCYRSLNVGRKGAEGQMRGRQFEKYARHVLCTQLGLKPPFPVPPGYKLNKAGLNDTEVDFCFFRSNVLVHIDMKSFCRNLNYHRGVYKAVRNRISDVTKQLRDEVEPRGEQLRYLLQQRGYQVDTVVNLLCVADVEYVPPGPQLRYGDTPRVLTAEEIAQLIADRSRWNDMVRAARECSA